MEESDAIPQVEGAKFKRKRIVNTQLLPIKLHYVLSYGAIGAMLPYLPLIIRSIGVNAAAFGVISTTIRFAAFLTKPIFGAIVDYSKNIRCVMIFIVLGTALFHSMMLLIQPIHANEYKTLIECGGNPAAVELPFIYNSSCIDHQQFPPVTCEMEKDFCASIKRDAVSNRNMSGLLCQSESEKAYLNFSLIPKNSTISHVTGGIPLFVFQLLNVNENVNASTICFVIQNRLTSLQCQQNTDSCVFPLQSAYVYDTHQFWIVFILTVLGGICYTAIFSLNDAACYELLKDRPQDYGVQRMYGSAAAGITGLIGGQLNDLQTSFGSGTAMYSPAFYVMIAFAISDVTFLLTPASLKMSTAPTNLTNSFKGIFRLFSSRGTAVFAAGAFIIGGLYAIHFTYEYLFLQSLGASQLLIGVDAVVQIFVVEVPSFFFSGWVIQKLGCSLCLVMAFAAYSLRYFLYSVLKNPWYALPIDILQSLTYCVFLSAMTSFASKNAPAGAEATMQGIFGGIFRGLGFGVGSLLGGFAYDKMGGHNTFFWAAIISLICVFVFSVFSYLLKAGNAAQSPETQIKKNTRRTGVTT